MEDGFIKVKMEVQQMQTQIMHFFSGYEEVLASLVEQELTNAKLVEAIQSEIKGHLRWKIQQALEDKVKKAVEKSKALDRKIDKIVEAASK